MKQTEKLTINGKAFIRTYSDANMLIERDGVPYSEALDLEELGLQYTETDEPIEPIEPATDEATEADYQAELRRLGVEL